MTDKYSYDKRLSITHSLNFPDIPLAVSFPHFYNSDPTLSHNIEGLSPSEEKHGTEIVIQPVSIILFVIIYRF